MTVAALAPVFCLTLVQNASAIDPQAKPGDPLPGLTPSQLQRFQLGKTLYNLPLTDSQGLGPIFNKSSCGNCHNNPLGGPGSQAVTRFGRVDKGVFNPLSELGGSLLQVAAISPTCFEFVPKEATVTALRITNGALAYGLVEAIPDRAILANRDSQPLAVQGVAHMVGAFEDPPASPLHVGRFGWKAQVATVLTFSADAGQNELGLSNRFVPFDNAPNGNMALLAQCDLVADPEDGPALGGGGLHFIDRVTDFQRFLAPPPQTPKSGMSGEVIFNNLGCAVCHTPSFTTSNNPALEDAIRNKAIRPYSDWLLHDVGQSADFIVQGAGTEQLLKTPPLWGLRYRDPIWHDGRIAGNTFDVRMEQVIAEHAAVDSDGAASATAFAALSVSDKAKVVAFLDSLGRLEFDADGDGDVQFDDFNVFKVCYAGGPYNADHSCAVSDIDQDTDVDLVDFDSFMISYVGPRRDCNSNGILDLRDVLLGTAADANNNGFLDTCEPTCDSDLNGTGTVNVEDLLAVISGWGDCPAPQLPCRGDLDFNRVVNTVDLLAIISAWGACP